MKKLIFFPRKKMKKTKQESTISGRIFALQITLLALVLTSVPLLKYASPGETDGEVTVYLLLVFVIVPTVIALKTFTGCFLSYVPLRWINFPLILITTIVDYYLLASLIPGAEIIWPITLLLVIKIIQ